MKPERIWIEQCEAAKGIEDQFGTAKALDYLVCAAETCSNPLMTTEV